MEPEDELWVPGNGGVHNYVIGAQRVVLRKDYVLPRTLRMFCHSGHITWRKYRPNQCRVCQLLATPELISVHSRDIVDSGWRTGANHVADYLSERWLPVGSRVWGLGFGATITEGDSHSVVEDDEERRALWYRRRLTKQQWNNMPARAQHCEDVYGEGWYE